MYRATRAFLLRAWTRVLDDVRSDRVLRVVLLLSIILSGFWLWWRAPNFISGDEMRRIGQPMKVAKIVFENPGPGAIERAAAEGVGRDATTYLHGLVLLPLFVAIVLSGELATIAGVDAGTTFSLWNGVPAWFWWSAVLLTRAMNALLVLGIVYLTYAVGTELADRRAGQIASVFTALSLIVVSTAHEVNEDTPMVFLLLLVLFLAIRYAENGDRRYFLSGCALGGLAIAFKLTGGVTVVFLATAYVLQASEDERPLESFWQPRLLLGGLVIGLVIIYVGIPNLLVQGPDWLLNERLPQTLSSKTSGATIPPGYRALLAYLNGLGLPLTIAVAGGLVASSARFVRRKLGTGELVLLSGVGVYVVVFFGLWSAVNTHHVLPSVPLLTILLGITLSRHYGSEYVRILLAILLITTSVYTAVGTYQYTNDPRDEAAEWLEENGDSDATTTVFVWTPADAGLVHGRPIDHYDFGRRSTFPGDNYTDWVRQTPDRQPEYIQSTGNLRDTDQYPRREAFMERLRNGDHYGYVVAAEFGERPEERSRLETLARAGVVPGIEKRSDYVRIYARNESLT